jgi:dynein assembly factor 3
MDKLNELGFVNFWGITPSLNAFYGENEIIEKLINNKLEEKETRLDKKENEKIAILEKDRISLLISNANDIRHILKTLFNLNEKAEKMNLNNNCKDNSELINLDIYVYETFQENIVRMLVFFDLILNSDLNNIEKIDMFLEIYANCLVTEKTHTYLHNSIKRLTDLIYGTKVEKKDDQLINLQELIDFSFLGYKDIDNFKDILDSYNKDTKFDIEKLREERLRFLYKDRYDSRENLVDWDYQMKTKKNVDHLGYNCYKRFRMNGVAFEKHNIKYNKPNKTLSSYIPGRSVSKYNLIKKKTLKKRNQLKTLFT